MEELDLKELISMFAERKFLIVLIILIFAIAGAVYTLKFVTPTYNSSTSLVLVQIGVDNSEMSNSITTTDITLNSKLVDNYRAIAQSKSIATTVIENLNLNTDLSTIQKSISVTSASDAEIIQITVENEDPELACKIAKEVAKVFIDKVSEIYKVSNIYVLDEAEVPTQPSNIHLAKNVVIFAFVGAILVSGYILLINMLDTTVKTDTDIEKVLNVPVLASIVLTEDNSKKKQKASTGKRGKNTVASSKFENLESEDIEVLYEHNSIIKNKVSSSNLEDTDENISMYNYMENSNVEENNSSNHKSKKATSRNHRRKGGKR